MKTFENQAAQGDLLIRRVDEIPKNFIKKVKPEETDSPGNYVLAHSETGHHHIVEAKKGVEFFRSTDDPLIAYLKVAYDVEVVLEHMRSYDTHEPLLIKGGTYELRRQREYVMGRTRMVTD